MGGVKIAKGVVIGIGVVLHPVIMIIIVTPSILKCLEYLEYSSNLCEKRQKIKHGHNIVLSY